MKKLVLAAALFAGLGLGFAKSTNGGLKSDVMSVTSLVAKSDVLQKDKSYLFESNGVKYTLQYDAMRKHWVCRIAGMAARLIAANNGFNSEDAILAGQIAQDGCDALLDEVFGNP